MGNLTITEAAVEQHVFAKLQPKQRADVKRVYLAGMKVIFDPKTHGQLVQGFEQQMKQSDDLAGNIGADIAHIIIILYGKSKGTMPLGSAIPAGSLLLAKLCEFLASTNAAPVDDTTFTKALHIMSVALLSKFDPKFKQKMGGNPDETTPAAATGQPAPDAAQQPAPPSGLLAQPQTPPQGV